MVRFYINPVGALNLDSVPRTPGGYDRVSFQVDGDPERRTFGFTRMSAELLAGALRGAPLRRGEVHAGAGPVSPGRSWHPRYAVEVDRGETRFEVVLDPVDDRTCALDRVPPAITIVLTEDEAGAVARELDAAIAEVAELRRLQKAQ